jgi:hypothetical protein
MHDVVPTRSSFNASKQPNTHNDHHPAYPEGYYERHTWLWVLDQVGKYGQDLCTVAPRHSAARAITSRPATMNFTHI